MNTTVEASRAAPGAVMPKGPMAPGAARILLPEPATSLRAHLARYGPLDLRRCAGLVEQVSDAGLRGRGGAGFPTAIKMAAVRDASARRRPPIVVANGTEGEPASAKDGVLLTTAPHLVLDGMMAAASALGAGRAILCIERHATDSLDAVRRALAERAGRDPLPIEIVEAPPRYTTGEETALVNWLNGGLAKPTFSPPRPSDRGVGGAPTLVDNVETVANIALIARYGASAYRMTGDSDEPGTVMVTVTGSVRRPGVYELPTGASLRYLLESAGSARPSGVLVGGYFGAWLSPDQALTARLSNSSLRPIGASLGCGLIAVMGDDHCPLPEVARVLHWLAASSAGQCGACVNGLPALAGAFERVVAGDRGEAGDLLDRWTPMVLGRGACKLPDGAAKFLDSARRTFADHIEQHRRHGPCPSDQLVLLPTPEPGEWR